MNGREKRRPWGKKVEWIIQNSEDRICWGWMYSGERSDQRKKGGVREENPHMLINAARATKTITLSFPSKID
jgi:hypothetical protein